MEHTLRFYRRLAALCHHGEAEKASDNQWPAAAHEVSHDRYYPMCD
ncbi:MAG TPA: hypothetical protein VHB73_02265 [Alphaproteobacteria bacterium]|nr:hypothetical protein [Alphaproteobacteria bacterium]